MDEFPRFCRTGQGPALTGSIDCGAEFRICVDHLSIGQGRSLT